MKSFTKGYVKLAINGVRANRWRSFLTMLGVIIGVASVIAVISISEGVKQQVNGQIAKLGRDLLTVRAQPVSSGQGVNGLTALTITSPLPGRDYGTVAATKGVDTAVPLTIVNGAAQGDMTANGTLAIGTTADLGNLLHQPLAYGQFWNGNEDTSNVAVLGPQAARQLFNENVPLGRSFSFRGQTFTVRGIFSSFDASLLPGTVNFNNAIFIPYAVAQSLTSQTAPLYEVLAKPVSSQQLDQTQAAITKRLLKSHAGQHDFAVLKSSQTLAVGNSIIDLLTRLVAGVAAIALLVGGVGIMNVMLVSVTERMHEIGIRKAVGATNRQVLGQFMVESAVLSLAGGLLGIAVAAIIDLLMVLFTDVHPVFSWQAVVLATGVSLLVGLLFGSVPAIKAARKEPIDALRNE